MGELWITFNEPKVLAFLQCRGFVYTVRHYPASEPFVRGARKGNNFLGFKVQLETVSRYDHLSDWDKKCLLAPHVKQSGFKTVEEWQEAIERQHTQHRELYLLKATIVKEKKCQ